jgi:hypothetical protein
MGKKTREEGAAFNFGGWRGIFRNSALVVAGEDDAGEGPGAGFVIRVEGREGAVFS